MKMILPSNTEITLTPEQSQALQDEMTGIISHCMKKYNVEIVDEL